MMNHTRLNRLVGASVFLVSLVVYLRTLSDTVVFWDVGEFIAAAFFLQVPHPPGSPLFLMIAKLFSMLPTAHDPAVRVHLVSPIASALTAALLYFSIVMLILRWKERPVVLVDKLAMYGGAAIGALSLTFAPTFWFNAEEAEVYGLSMLFVGLITFLALQWNERADVPGSERYILLLAYLIGLSVGVHLLSLLVMFPFMLIFYFRRYTFSISSFLIFAVASLGVFALVYPGIIKWLPGLMDGSVSVNGQEYSSVAIALLPYLIIGGALYGVYYSHLRGEKLLNMALLSALLIVLGYSTYTLVMIRANEHVPMNEDNPNTLTRLESYLNREQYGEAPLLNRRYLTEPKYQATYARYSSDTDYFLRYQLDHMFLRYFLWQYAGISGDKQDAGVNWHQLLGIPLIVGIFGCCYQFVKDRRMWFVVLTFFIIMGVVLAFYFNMQEPQPRERDYFFVGCFFAFSMWIGIGALGLIELARKLFKEGTAQTYATGGVLLVGFALIPVNMLRTNFRDADRTGNYVAWDYSYNLLQTCEPDALLFTNGDNDTFPLWYLQDVEGVRRDVRIINMSLANTPWYVHQLKDEAPFGAKKVPLTLSDAQIDALKPFRWEVRQMTLRVPRNVVEEYAPLFAASPQDRDLDSSVTNSGVIRFTLTSTAMIGETPALRVQDIVTWSIISGNMWQRPVYFASTCTPDCRLGLDEYLRSDGIAAKLIPVATAREEGTIVDSITTAELFNSPSGYSKTFQRGYKFRGLNDSTIHFDDNVRRLMVNYRNAFLRLALHDINVEHDSLKARTALDSMESKIPHRVIPMEPPLLYELANFYGAAGAKEKEASLMNEAILRIQDKIKANPREEIGPQNPYSVLLAIYERREEYDKAIDVLTTIKDVYSATHPGIGEQIDARIAELRARIVTKNAILGDTAGVARRAKK